MSTFYVLPPRPLLGERFTAYLRGLFPGLDWSRTCPTYLAELLTAAVQQPDVFVVCREDLPDGEDVGTALRNGFGAEAGDEVVEVRSGARPGEWTFRRWDVGSTAVCGLG